MMATTLNTIVNTSLWSMVTIFICLLSGPTQSGERVPAPIINTPTNVEGCIRPTEFMRRNHMHLLTHKRDKTLRQGIRTKDASLSACVDCHADKKADGSFIPVNAPGQFCSVCHEYTAVKLDCFECHRTTPDLDLGTTQAVNPQNKILVTGDTEIHKLLNYLNEVQ
ncbi:MAG: hypothetical protein GY761_01855 [Hyphomicrobiales bacterium]|nr:hypothetical protein [Hyphomicrobiales bacterium]